MNLAAPYAEDLVLDRPLERAPSLTLDEGLAAAYLGISGDPLPLALSGPLTEAVTGRTSALANPALALSIAIGQSTVATRRVIANLYYRDLALARQVHLGETLTTEVTPVAAAWTRSGMDRAKVLLDISVDSSDGDRVAHFQRLALLPVREPERLVERSIPQPADDAPLDSFATPDWNLSALPGRFDLEPGQSWTDPLRDTVSSARELVRLTLNVAAAHRDAALGIGGRRLAYGGHTVALAQASLSRTVPGLATIIAWRECDHIAPVFEDDLLETSVRIDAVAPVAGGALVDATVEVTVDRGDDPVPVLRWRPVLLVATNGGAA